MNSYFLKPMLWFLDLLLLYLKVFGSCLFLLLKVLLLVVAIIIYLNYHFILLSLFSKTSSRKSIPFLE